MGRENQASFLILVVVLVNIRFLLPKTYVKWDESLKPEIVRLLKACPKSSNGDFIMDYFATVWVLIKKYGI